MSAAYDALTREEVLRARAVPQSRASRPTRPRDEPRGSTTYTGVRRGNAVALPSVPLWDYLERYTGRQWLTVRVVALDGFDMSSSAIDGFLTVDLAAELTGYSKDTIAVMRRDRNRGVARFRADEIARRLGVHPVEIWGEWWRGLPDLSANADHQDAWRQRQKREAGT